MEMIILASPCNTNLSRTVSFKNSKNIRDASFSSYLNVAEEAIVHKLAESGKNSVNSFSSIPYSQEPICGMKKKVEGEIDVFDAEKYFNGGMDEESPVSAHKVATPTKLQPPKDEADDQSQTDSAVMKKQVPSGSTPTPSVHSESSWNSQRALLQAVPRSQSNSRTRTKRSQNRRFLGSLGCFCNDKKSVDIGEQRSENGCSNESVSSGLGHGKAMSKQSVKTCDLVKINKTKSHSSSWAKGEEKHCKKFDDPVALGVNGEASFSFPALSAKQQIQEELDISRKSLKFFGSPHLEKGKKTLSLERRITMLTWDAIPRMEEEPGIPASTSGMHHDDTESDASSDLFEIESFSNNANPSFPRQESDGGMSSCVTPTTCYAPSEASIEWSVVTASAADFSVVSDSEELRTSIRNNVKAAAGKEMKKRSPNILLGCKSHKAVRVAGDAYIPNAKVIPDPRIKPQRLMNSFTPETRFQAQNKVTRLEIDSRHRQHGFNVS